MSYTVSYIANSYYGLAVWRAVAFNDHSTRVREMGKKRQLLARSRLEKDVFSSYVALQSARSLPPAPNSLSLRGWFFDDVDPPRRLKGDYYTCSHSDRGYMLGWNKWRGERPRVRAFFSFITATMPFLTWDVEWWFQEWVPYSCYPTRLAIRIAERRSFLGKFLNQRTT